MVDVSITGVDEILKKLHKMPERVQKNVLTGAIRAGANSIRKEARMRAPKQSGALSKSISTVRRKEREKNIVSFSVVPRLSKKHGFLAHMHEFGTSKMPASPFMRPAFYAKGHETIDVAKNYMRKRIDREIAKL